jgi:CheY-like chemotaxis protein
MQEIYLKSLLPPFLTEDGGDWGIAITQFPCVLGRHADCAARINHPMISRRHCSFSLRDDQVWVRDLGSRNGTTVNGTPLQDAQPLHDGDRVELASLPFEVRLPVSPATPAVIPDAAAPESEPGGPPHRVLVVEDNPSAAASLAQVLQQWGHEVRVAHDGPEAMRVAQADRPDTVLLDICLPGMDGYRVARQLRARRDLAKARLVGITGYGPTEDRQPSDEGFDCLLTKPVDLGALQEVLAHPG